jgi:GDPmannose 4,6-dehydratase
VLGEQAVQAFNTRITGDEAWLLGVLAAEGYITPDGNARITCGDAAVMTEAAERWGRVAGGYVAKRAPTPSAFNPDRVTSVIALNGNGPYLRMLRHELYTETGKKRVPKRVLNATPIEQEHFLTGYNLGDGLRAGLGVDEFKAFRTTSPTLAAGLMWLARTALCRRVSVYLQPGALGGGSSYLINVNSALTPGDKGAHLKKPQEEVRNVERRSFTGWTYDLATESERFAAGVGSVVIHNSPKRGLEFVTRKITNSLARIKLGLQDSVTLGNLDSARDWGFAGDYVEAMWLMLQQDSADDYVIATGETHTIREFLDAAFECAGYDDWARYVQQDPRFERPTEVDLLMGDATKARKHLGWSPKVNFDGLVRVMYESDLAEESARSDSGR